MAIESLLSHKKLVDELADITKLDRHLAYTISEYCDQVSEDDKVRGFIYRLNDRLGRKTLLIGTSHIGPPKGEAELIYDRIRSDYEKAKTIGVEFVNEDLLATIDTIVDRQLDLTEDQLDQGLKKAETLYSKDEIERAEGYCKSMTHPILGCKKSISSSQFKAYVLTHLARGSGFLPPGIKLDLDQGVESIFVRKSKRMISMSIHGCVFAQTKNIIGLEDVENNKKVIADVRQACVHMIFLNNALSLLEKCAHSALSGNEKEVTEFINDKNGVVIADLFNRNRVQAKKIMEVDIALVGAMHLFDDPDNPDNKGVLTLLKEDGVTVTPFTS